MSELSPERVGRITSSRVAGILGLSRHGQTPATVMREMVRQHYGLEPEWKGNYITRKGQQLEPLIRGLYQRSTRMMAPPAPFIVCPTVPWLGATPDGLVGQTGVLEMKLAGAGYFHYSQRPDYEVQCRVHLKVTERDWCDLAMYHDVPGRAEPEPPWISRIEYDPDWWPSVEDRLAAFHEQYLINIKPESPDEQWIVAADGRTDDEWARAAQEWHERRAELAAAQAALDEATATLVTLSEGRSTRGYGVSVSVAERTGAIDWKAAGERWIPQDADLEPFRRKASVVTSVREVKE